MTLYYLSVCPSAGVPTQFLDIRIKYNFGKDKWIKLKLWGYRINLINSGQDWMKHWMKLWKG